MVGITCGDVPVRRPPTRQRDDEECFASPLRCRCCCHEEADDGNAFWDDFEAERVLVHVDLGDRSAPVTYLVVRSTPEPSSSATRATATLWLCRPKRRGGSGGRRDLFETAVLIVEGDLLSGVCDLKVPFLNNPPGNEPIAVS